MIVIESADFNQIMQGLRRELAEAPIVEVGEWQAQVGLNPFTSTLEVEDVSLSWPIPPTVKALQEAVKPNLPWAEEHFLERVSGIPYNPPPSHVRWPFARRSNAEHVGDDERFSHTYPERIWPKYAGAQPLSMGAKGIRYPIGDLSDLVHLLQTRPGTRQAFLPIWFPEDTGAVQNQRVPCTLGYHFLLRGTRLKTVYYIRSCDFYRHFQDDFYMAARLCQWVAEKLPQPHAAHQIHPGHLVMHISSLHVFSAERERIFGELTQNQPRRDAYADSSNRL